jgi:thiamine kinase-like enzyme
VAATQQDVASRDVTPDLAETDRVLLANTLRDLRESIVNRRAAEQLLHGEPHPWNVLNTTNGPFFMDFENCADGPVEFDLAWLPKEVSERYPDADQDLVGECRGSYWRSTQCTAGVATTNTRAADNREWTSSTLCGRVRLGARSIPCSAQKCRPCARRSGDR